MGFTEAVTNGQELGNEMMRPVQMPLPLEVNCGEEVLAVLFEAMLGGKELTEILTSELCSKSLFSQRF